MRPDIQALHDGSPAWLERWIAWGRRCRVEAFVNLQKTLGKHRDAILSLGDRPTLPGLTEPRISQESRRKYLDQPS